MNSIPKVTGIFALIALTASGASSGANEGASKYSCQSFGGGAPEALGDDLLISTDQYTCHVDSGPMSGGVLTGTTMWKWNGPEATMVSGEGIARKAGAAWVFVQTEGKIVVTMINGKAVGFGASGKGRIAAGTGTVAAMAGKTTKWTVTPTGLRQFTVEESIE